MTLVPVGGGVDYVDTTAPTSPNDAEVWMDISNTPPTVKVYDADNSVWETSTNVLSDGTRFKGADIGGIVDWSSKTPKHIRGDELSVTGSGYVVWYRLQIDDASGSEVAIEIDGTEIHRNTTDGTDKIYSPAVFRFDSSFSTVTPGTTKTETEVGYVLD